jgi:predicted transcriptional regulator
MSEGQRSKPIALTLKVDQARYEALKVLGARTRRSNQEILLAALDAYLEEEQIP